MGQYYKAYLKDAEGGERVFSPQSAIYMTVNGLRFEEQITEHRYDWDDPKSWGSCFSGLKLMEHSWMENDFVNGVVEHLWGNPCRVAWVGDYADAEADYDGTYTREVYESVWGEAHLPYGPFDAAPKVHRAGFIINHDKGRYIDLEAYSEHNSFSPRWDKGRVWCIHPLPLLTAIGNGRGGGDYWDRNPCSEAVGSWAMDLISFRLDRPIILEEVDYGSIAFSECD